MDSITQAALGAAIGEATIGRQVGKKAIAWGAVVGSLADLDVIFNPLLDEVSKLSWHRGYSHALLFNLIAAPLVGWLLSRLHRGQASTRDWIRMAVWVMIGAIMIDAFTVYGTQLLMPFSDYPVGFNSIAIVDPLFTVPLLIGVIIALFLRKESVLRRRISTLALVLASTYLVLTVAFKAHVNAIAEKEFALREIQVERYMSGPTLFNSILWRVMAEVDEGYYYGYYSLFDREHKLELNFIPRNDSLLAGLWEDRAVRTLLWFSQGYYEMRREDEQLYFTDLRFGELEVGSGRPRKYIFRWALEPSGQPAPDSLTIRQVPHEVEDAGQVLRSLFTRMGGI